MQQIDGSRLIKEITPDDLKNACGGAMEFSACVHKIRAAGAFSFVMLRTGRYVFQAIYNKSVCKSKGLCEGAYAEFCGEVKDEPRAVHGVEIILTDFKLMSVPAEKYPLPVSDSFMGCSLDTNLKNRAVALRHPKERAVFKISEGAANGFRNFMLENNFTEIYSPKICRAIPEGGTNVFRLKYFGEDAVLAQSPQLYKQACIAFFDRVFEIAPAYRADKHNSTRHLNEYIELDFEMGFIHDMTDVMMMMTAALRAVTEYIAKNCRYELDLLSVQLPEITSIPAVTFHEALDILKKPQDHFDLDPTDESKLCEYAKKEYNSEFIFVTKFPSQKRPFYAMDSPGNPALSESFDLLFRGLETASGGQRIHDYRAQAEKLERYGIAPGELEAYLSVHKYGIPPHGGAGIGLERFVMKLLELDNIRRASLFPRDMHSLRR